MTASAQTLTGISQFRTDDGTGSNDRLGLPFSDMVSGGDLHFVGAEAGGGAGSPVASTYAAIIAGGEEAQPLNLIFITPGNYTIEDDGVPGNNTSVIKDGSGTVIFTFIHPADSLGFTVSTPGVNLTLNFTDSLGAASLTVGSLTDPADTPDSITVRSINTSGAVTLVSNGAIVEGGTDAAADIVAGSLVLSAVTGVGTAGNAVETQTGALEAEAVTGGINLSNFGSVQIGGVSADVDGLDVATSGNLLFTNVGTILIGDETGPETVHGGTTSGNVSLVANGFDADIIATTDQDAINAPGGNIILQSGRDIAFG
ncbi:MAG TPA: hypothetical protein VJM13_07745, partial [Sphingopyxis sp.]|nr:hypothetical protein [Sphingopyxis sp.]